MIKGDRSGGSDLRHTLKAEVATAFALTSPPKSGFVVVASVAVPVTSRRFSLLRLGHI